jgi:Na+-transporting NADH:ubiquinone oxidoreductase subunit NqrC
MKKYLTKNNITISICAALIFTFWTYLLFQVEVRNSLWLLISNIDSIVLMYSVIIAGILYLINELKKFKTNLFDRLETITFQNQIIFEDLKRKNK